MKDYQLSFAQSDDNNQLLDLVNQLPVSATGLSYSLDRSPDYFALNSYQGHKWRVITAKEHNLLLGAISVIFDQAYLEGSEYEIAYTAELRVKNEARGTGLADRLMQEATQTCLKLGSGKQTPVFTVVMKDNPAGLKKNQNLERDNIIIMKQVAEIISYFIFPFNSPFNLSGKKEKYRVRTANENDLSQMYQLWEHINSKKNLTRSFDVNSFHKWVNRIGFDSYIVAVDLNENIKGFMGLWNQQDLRKVIISRETTLIRVIRFLWNSMSILSKMPKFPQVEEVLSFHSVINLCVEDVDVFSQMLKKAFETIKKERSLFLALALDKRDPLNKTLKKYKASCSELNLLSSFDFVGEPSLFHSEIALG